MGQWLAQQVVGPACAYAVLEGGGVATRRVHRHGSGGLYGQATVGRCSRLGWYHGLPVLTVVSPQGVVTGYAPAPAASSEQVVAETLLAGRHSQRRQQTTPARPMPPLPEVGRPRASGR